MTTTTAEQIANIFGNDGQRWELADGRDLDEVCRAHGAVLPDAEWNTRDSDIRRYTFGDGSSIVASGGAWDLGLDPGCWCWAGVGHSDDCAAAHNIG